MECTTRSAARVPCRAALQVFTVGQTWVMDFEGTNYLLKAVDLAVIDEVNMTVEAASSFQGRPLMGMVGRDTKPLLKVGAMSDKLIKLSNMPLSTSLRSADVFKKDWNFETLGIGGLDTEFGAVFRRAFGSRIFPPSIVEKLGVTHVKGILLHGPPGTGKTLMARQIGKMLNCKEPKKVSVCPSNAVRRTTALFKGRELHYGRQHMRLPSVYGSGFLLHVWPTLRGLRGGG